MISPDILMQHIHFFLFTTKLLNVVFFVDHHPKINRFILFHFKARGTYRYLSLRAVLDVKL